MNTKILTRGDLPGLQKLMCFCDALIDVSKATLIWIRCQQKT